MHRTATIGKVSVLCSVVAVSGPVSIIITLLHQMLLYFFTLHWCRVRMSAMTCNVKITNIGVQLGMRRLRIRLG